MSIVVVINSIWSVQNYIASGMLHDLRKSSKISIVVGQNFCENISSLNLKEFEYTTLERPKYTKINLLFREIFRVEFERRTNIISLKSLKQNKRVTRSFYSLLLVQLLSLSHVRKALYEVDRLVLRLANRRIMRQLNQLGDVLLATSCVDIFDRRLAALFDGKSVGIVNSFDNITSRGFIEFHHFSKIAVWSKMLRKELDKFYDISSSDTFLFGAPQFSSHFEYKSLQFHIPNYILYCTNHCSHTPKEPELVNFLISYTRNVLRDFSKWVIRLHPLERADEWLSIKSLNNVELQFPDTNFDSTKMPSTLQLTESISGAKKVISVASTISIDAACCGVDFCSVAFHPRQDLIVTYKTLHESYHYKSLVRHLKIPVIDSLDSYKEFITNSYGQNDTSHLEYVIGPPWHNSNLIRMLACAD